MNRHRRGAGVLHHSREERSIAIAIAPSGTHFYGDGNLDGLRHRTDDSRGVAGSRMRLHPALCFAILGTGQPMFTSTMSAPIAFDDLRRVSHLLGIATEDLDRDRPLFFGVFRVLQRAVDTADQTLRTRPSRSRPARSRLVASPGGGTPCRSCPPSGRRQTARSARQSQSSYLISRGGHPPRQLPR